ncbi:MAG: alpha/beta fold hydrolase [Solirubrobacteraceae bacterium]
MSIAARVAFNHQRSGRGEPLVLIHGVGHHLQGWRPVAALLEDAFEVYAVDSPGFGRSEPLPPGNAPTVDAHADAFAAWFERSGLDRPHVAGNSMGGGIALELARRSLVRSVTAISPVGFWTDAERSYALRLLMVFAKSPRPLRPALLRLAATSVGRAALFGVVFARPWRTPPREAQSLLIDLWASPAIEATLRAFERYDCAPFAPDGNVPITVAWGSRDVLLPYWRQAPRARELLPQARHVTLAGLGHTPFYDDPGVVAHTIRAGAAGG